jgi:hypothetical protein
VKKMPQEIREWMKEGNHLPSVLRDFHDQKDTFKSIHTMINVEGHEYVKDVSWVTGQCYVIDIFLWWMGWHGYTLQKSRAKMPFADLETDRDDDMAEWRLPLRRLARAARGGGVRGQQERRGT